MLNATYSISHIVWNEQGTVTGDATAVSSNTNTTGFAIYDPAANNHVVAHIDR